MNLTERELEMLPRFSVVEATFTVSDQTSVIRTLVQMSFGRSTLWIAVGGPLEDQWTSAALVEAAADVTIVR